MSLQLPDATNICSIIITFHPDRNFPKRLPLIARQVNKVIIVDNNSGDTAQRDLNDLVNNTDNAELICNSTNLGIAQALNIGVQWACDHGYHWVLTLDQDSDVEPTMINELSNVCATYGEKERIAVIGPNHIDSNSKQLYYTPSKNISDPWIERKTIITSGSLISTAVWKHIGPFRESFFIDSVDHEFCLRARRKGYKIILSLKPGMKHSMGMRTIHRFPLMPSLKITATNYPPFRWYFMTRNRLILVFEYLFSDFLWSLSRLIRLLGLIGIMCLFECNRIQKMKHVWWGALDALTRNANREIVGLD